MIICTICDEDAEFLTGTQPPCPCAVCHLGVRIPVSEDPCHERGERSFVAVWRVGSSDDARSWGLVVARTEEEAVRMWRRGWGLRRGRWVPTRELLDGLSPCGIDAQHLGTFVPLHRDGTGLD